MKKLIILICVVALSIIMTFYQIHIIKKQTLQTFRDVVILSKSVEAGKRLEASDLEMGKINTLWHSSDYYTRIEDVVGMNMLTDLSKYSILSKQILSETVDEQEVSSPDHAMTTLKVLPEEALCFRFDKGEEVLLYHIDPLYVEKDLGVVMIKAIYDNNLEDTGLPVYLLIEANQEVIREIVRLRESGRFEIIRGKSQ